MTFSARTAWEPGTSAWAEAVTRARGGGKPLLDMTIANPTVCGLLPRPEGVLAPLTAPEVLEYMPDPLGMRVARDAVAAYYGDHGAVVDTGRICLTTSTSEAYSFLFRLLCDAGDEVLIARPSYPLFDLLARLDDVHLHEYPLFYEPGALAGGGWQLDFGALERAVGARTRAIIVVHPNNPTGHFVSAPERELLVNFCAERDLALIVDEVFLDYPHAGPEANGPTATFAAEERCLTFVLSGISKVCALPQMKVSWIAASGPRHRVDEALRRLEIISDTFLSVNAPVQAALPAWLAGRHEVQARVRQRLRLNLAALDARLAGSLAGRLALEGGWTAVLRAPRFVQDQPFADAALTRGVVVQPGELYGLPDGRCVLSLLTEPAIWRQGLDLLPV